MPVIRQGAEDGLFTSPVFFLGAALIKADVFFSGSVLVPFPPCHVHMAPQAEIWLLEAAGFRLGNLRLYFWLDLRQFSILPTSRLYFGQFKVPLKQFQDPLGQV
jgi:hypothetical protein